MVVRVESAGQAKLYTVAQAGRLARTSPQNARRWLFGYEGDGHRMDPVFGTRQKEAGPIVSFVELCELALVASFRRASPPVSLDRLRRAYAFAQRKLKVDHPFASERIRAQGGHVLYEFTQLDPGPGTLVLDQQGQLVLPIEVTDVLDGFDFGDDHLAARWYLFGRNTPLVVDPARGSGLPTIEGRNLRAEVLYARWKAGEDIPALAEDFALEEPVVEAAVRALAA